MSLEGDITLLRKIPLFADLPTEQLRLLAFSSARIDIEAGQALFAEGDAALSGYVVASGAIELSVSEGKEQAATLCGPATLIGELALFIDTRRPASARATTTSQLLEIDRKLITRMLHEYPHLALRLRAKLAERLTATVSELSQVRRSLLAAGGPPRP